METPHPLSRATRLRKEGRSLEAQLILKDAIRRGRLDPASLADAGAFVRREIREGRVDGPIHRVLLAGQFTTQRLVDTLVSVAFGKGLVFDASETEYDNVLQGLEALSVDRRPDALVLLPWNQRVLGEGASDLDDRIAGELAFWTRAHRLAEEKQIPRRVQLGYDLLGPGPEGYASSSAVTAVRRLNQDLRSLIPTGQAFIDLEQLAGAFGRASFYDPRNLHWIRQPFSEAGLVWLAEHLTASLRASFVGPKKMLVLDLDDTLWGGVVGELGPLGIELVDSPEGNAFRAFQRHVKALSRRGVLLAVASKNNPKDARAPFLENHDMILGLDDFASFQVGWEPKATMLERIAAELKLGLDSMVFFDDNPAEREEVRQHRPEVAVVEVPAEPAEFVRTLENALWFESIQLTEEDRGRAAAYVADHRRRALEQSSGSMAEYLESLEMKASIAPIEDHNLQRVVQLLAKTNQFNLTSRRYGASDVQGLVAGGAETLTMKLSDRFGDHGLVALMIVAKDAARTWRIDSWLMSCRVIGRTAEECLFGVLLDRATAAGVERLIGEFVPTAKNALVRELYPRLGFSMLPETDPSILRFELMLSRAVRPTSPIVIEPDRDG